MAEYKGDPVVVIGLGRFGTSLALELTRRGTEVLAIDHRPKITQSLAGQITQIATADATDMEALRQLGVPDFYQAVVAVGSDIEASILTTSLLVELEINDIWAKAVSSQHGRILDRIGAHHVVFPEHDMGRRVAHLLTGRMIEFVQLDEGFALVELRPPRQIVGRSLADSEGRTRHGITVVSIKPEGASFTYATPDTVPGPDDIIVVAGETDRVKDFANLG